MKKLLVITILFALAPIMTLAQSNTFNGFPQEVQDLLNSDPSFGTSLEEIYNTKFNIKSAGIEEQFTFTVTPSVPRPGQAVTAEIESYSTDLNRSEINWYVNGALVKKGLGAKTHQFAMGELGKLTTLRVVIIKQSGETVERSYSFRPAEVDLIYEAQTYVHPLYEGKAYFSRQSAVKVNAIPQVLDSGGRQISAKNLIYKWYVDGSLVQSSSGYGKDSFIYESNVLTTGVEIGVEVGTLTQDSVAYSTIGLVPVDPQIIVYEKDPLMGTLYNRAIIENLFIGKPEVEVEASPFSFNLESLQGGSTSYTWKLNGTEVKTPNSNTVVLRNEQNDVGQSDIGIEIRNGTLLQQATADFRILFSNTNLNEFSF